VRKPIPKPSILDQFEFLGSFGGERRWRSHDGRRLYTWDALHGEVEVFNSRGKHLGALDPKTGILISPPSPGGRLMSRKERRPFVELCLSGEVAMEQIDDFVDDWHAKPSDRSLSEFLGMTEQEYSLWVQDPDVLPYVIRARRERRSFESVVRDELDGRVAAHSDHTLALERLRRWLQQPGKSS
jgi:hypothetical protein